jgi:hypothetical protein
MSKHSDAITDDWYDKSVYVIRSYFPSGLAEEFYLDYVQAPLTQSKKDQNVMMTLSKTAKVLYDIRSSEEAKKAAIVDALKKLKPAIMKLQPSSYHKQFDEHVLRMMPDIDLSSDLSVKFLSSLPQSIRSDLCSVSTTMKSFCAKNKAGIETYKFKPLPETPKETSSRQESSSRKWRRATPSFSQSSSSSSSQ